MVLSNKKLKQKLREAKSESIASSISGEAISQSNGKPDTILELQERLDAAKQKTRLVKKDKRLSSRGPENEDKGSVNGKNERNKNNDKESVDGKKRKREEEHSTDKVEKKANMTKKKKKKKSKVKNKKSKENANGVVDKEKVVIDGVESKEEMPVNVESLVIKDIATKVYVGGIPYYSTEDDIRSFFDSCGTITEVDCMKFPDSGKFRGIAIINFKTDAAAKRALDLDGADMGGFFLKVKPYSFNKTTQQTKVPDFVPQVVKGYNRIYVGNLSWDITEENLRHFFADCKISSIRFGTDKETGDFRGYGHVDFSDDVSMMMALKMDQQIVCGRPIKISCAVPKKAADAQTIPRATIEEASKPEVDSTPITIPMTNEARHDDKISTISMAEVVRNEASSIEAPVPVSGKIKRRTCYECGEKGHLSSACPNKQNTDVTNPSANNVSMMSQKMDQQADARTMAGPRTTFEEASKPEVGSTPIIGKARRYDEFPTMSTAEVVRIEASSIEAPVPSSGKIKRRTCYECGEKGHISSACPNKQNTDVTNPSTDNVSIMSQKMDQQADGRTMAGLRTTFEEASKLEVDSTPITIPIIKKARHYDEIPTMSTAEVVRNEASSIEAPVPSSGKIKRRTCYECGQKGHISTACPNKQNTDVTIPSMD